MQNNSICLDICVWVLALIWYLVCEKWVWNTKVLDIWLTLGHIRKVAALKTRTRPCLSCGSHPGSSSTRTVFYLSVERNLSLHVHIVSRSILSWRAVSLMHFPASNNPQFSLWYAEAIAQGLPKVRQRYNRGKLEVFNLRNFVLAKAKRWGQSIIMTNPLAYFTSFWKARTSVTNISIDPAN